MEWGAGRMAGGEERKKGWEAKGSGPQSWVCWNERTDSLASEKTVNSHQEPHGCSLTLPGCKDHLPAGLRSLCVEG